MTNILAEKAVLASLSISRWSARKFDKKVTDEVHTAHNADSETGRYSKRLVSKDAMSDLNSVATAARNFHYEHTQPWLDDGARVLPSSLYLEYAEKMRDFRAQFEAASEAFCATYPDVVAAAKKRMNGLFNERDYPSPAKIRRFFDFDLAILPCPDTQDFRIAITQDNVEDIRKDVEARMQRVLQSSVIDSAQRITETIGHMSERLHAYVPAKKRGDKAENTFRDSLVEHVRDLAKLLPAFNLTGDAKLAEIIARIDAQLCNAAPDDLRSDDDLRKRVAEDADAILRDVSDFLS